MDVTLNVGGQTSNERKFSYVPPLISALSTIDKYGILREEYPTSGCYDDRFSRNSRGEIFCDNPVLLRITGTSMGVREGSVEIRAVGNDTSSSLVVGTCVCRLGLHEFCQAQALKQQLLRGRLF